MFEEVLINNGWEKLWQDEYGLHCFKNNKYILMVYEWDNITKVALRETFDRWSLAEYEFDFVPYTEKMYLTIKQEIEKN